MNNGGSMDRRRSRYFRVPAAIYTHTGHVFSATTVNGVIISILHDEEEVERLLLARKKNRFSSAHSRQSSLCRLITCGSFLSPALPVVVTSSEKG